jgi:hypothetical protein
MMMRRSPQRRRRLSWKSTMSDQLRNHPPCHLLPVIIVMIVANRWHLQASMRGRRRR